MRRHKREIETLLERARTLAQQDEQGLLQYIVAMALCENRPAHGGKPPKRSGNNDNHRP